MKTAIGRRAALLVSLAASLVAAQSRAFAQEAPAQATAKGVAAVLQPFVDNHSLAGAVTLVADKQKILSLEAVGFADIAAGKPMQTDALFWIASQSKPMTATAVMMLVDDGKISLDDPVAKFLPEFNDVWLAVEKDSDHVLLKRPKHKITDSRSAQSYQRIAVHVGTRKADARLAAPARRREKLRHHAAPVRARHQVPVLQRRNQYRRPNHRSGQRHALRGIHGEAIIRAAGNERHDVLAE